MSTKPGSSADSHAAQAEGPVGLGRRTCCAWAAASQQRTVSVAAGVLVLVLVMGVVLLRHARQAITTVDHEERISLGAALDALNGGFYAEARELANKMRQQPLSVDERGGPAFILGVVAMHNAGELLLNDQRHYYALAARYLEEARAVGFPEGCEAEGLFLLGKCQCLAGRPFEGRPCLEKSIQLECPSTAEAHRLLAAAYMDGPKRDLHQALAHITAYVAQADLSAAERQDGLMLQAQLHWELQDLEACRADLEKILPEAIAAPDAALLRGRLLLEAVRNSRRIGRPNRTKPAGWR